MGRFFCEGLTIVFVETFSTGRRLGDGRSIGSTIVKVLSDNKILKIKLHLFFSFFLSGASV